MANLAEVAAHAGQPREGAEHAEDVLAGVQHILAEQIAETADVRAAVRDVLWDTRQAQHDQEREARRGRRGASTRTTSSSTSRSATFRRTASWPSIAARRKTPWSSSWTAISRECRQAAPGTAAAGRSSARRLPAQTSTADALSRLLLPSLEREIRRELTERAEAHAVSVFARNLRSLLLAPPLRGRRVLAIDPGFRTGCKLAVLDETRQPARRRRHLSRTRRRTRRPRRKTKLEELIRKHQVQVIAIGNGTACRETEEARVRADRRPRDAARSAGTPSAPTGSRTAMPGAARRDRHLAAAAACRGGGAESGTAEACRDRRCQRRTAPLPPRRTSASDSVRPPRRRRPAATGRRRLHRRACPTPPTDLAYVIVNEAGASVYSASPVGREEFPDYDATLRGTISIGRRLQDPLSELVKIDPQNVGVGLYQHDVSPQQLKESLDGVVESCVNQVGVDLNTASVPLLRHVSGLNQLVARELVEYRKQHGPFRSREQLMQVPGIGPARYVQAAGFLKIGGGDNPLDGTWIHPESYPAGPQLLGELGYGPDVLLDERGSTSCARSSRVCRRRKWRSVCSWVCRRCATSSTRWPGPAATRAKTCRRRSSRRASSSSKTCSRAWS